MTRHRKLGSILDEQELDREIASVQEQLKQYQVLIQRLSALRSLKEMAYRLWGKKGRQAKAASDGHSEQAPASRKRRSGTTGDELRQVLAGGPMAINEILAAMRARGYAGSGNDKVDKKRLLAAMYVMKERFVRQGDKWGVKN